MYVRLDNAQVIGVLQVDGHLNAERMKPSEVADEILNRYRSQRSSSTQVAKILTEKCDSQSSLEILSVYVAQATGPNNGDVCLNVLAELIADDSRAYSLLTLKADYDFKKLGVAFQDADDKLFEADRAMKGHSYSLFCMAVYLIGLGIAECFEHTGSAERLLQDMIVRLTKIADVGSPIESLNICALFAACAERNQQKAALLLDTEFDI